MSTSIGTAWRIVPLNLREARRPHRLVERSVMVYRRSWSLLVTGFFEPLFYLLSIQVGLGALVGDVTVDGRTVPYEVFVAPALLASSAMNGAVYDSTMNIFFKLKHAKTYEAVLVTPLGPGDVALGEIAWALIRGQLYASAFLICMVVLGLAQSPWVILALPIAALIGFAFAAVGMAATTYMRTWADFEWVPIVTLPMFLFSATFFPASEYGRFAWLLQLSPLYHGNVLVRAADAGVWSATLLWHAGFLVVMGLAGLGVAARRLSSLLLT